MAKIRKPRKKVLKFLKCPIIEDLSGKLHINLRSALHKYANISLRSASERRACNAFK